MIFLFRCQNWVIRLKEKKGIESTVLIHIWAAALNKDTTDSTNTVKGKAIIPFESKQCD